jgi:hypothetical protein
MDEEFVRSICIFFNSPQGCKNVRCEYLHEKGKETKPCKYFTTTGCKFGVK